MKSGRSTQAPNSSEERRFLAIREIGCIVALRLDLGHIPPEVHHLTIGGKHGSKRRGHEFTIGLNMWSHRGVPLPGWTRDQCRDQLGPSYAREPVAFREAFGADDLLLGYQDRLIRDWASNFVIRPW